MLGCQVVRLGAVDICVKQLPAVVVECALVDHGAVFCRHLPAVVPQPTCAEHLVVLRSLPGGHIAVFEAVPHRYSRHGRLPNALRHFRRSQTTALEDGRDDVGAVVILVPYLTAGLEALGPVDDHRSAVPPAYWEYRLNM